MMSLQNSGSEKTIQSSVYKIAGVTIRINTEWEYEEFHSFENFLVNADVQEDIRIQFMIIQDKMEFDSEPVSTTAYSRYYNKDGKLWRVYYSPPGNEACSFICLNKSVQNGVDYFRCYVPKNMLYIFENSIQLFNAIGIEDLLMIRGVMVLHSSYIKWNQQAILFTAPSGTGKSTQARLWTKYENARIINGDRTAINSESGKCYANGLPIAGSSEIYINERNEIGAIVVLRQSDENHISRIKGIEAVKYILNQVFIQGKFSESYTKAVSAAVEVAENIPIFLLECRPDRQAVEMLRDSINNM